jgi:DNA helicase-2/ATP-dependent DNA helicase PcrA
VADEDQSIYRWRGADYRNIERLRDDHPDLATHLLEQNYRSTQTILDAAQAIIRRNFGRTEKTLFTRRGSGLRVVVHATYDQDQEARFVVDTIQDLVLSKQNRPGDCAVMYRTNAQSRAIEDAFIRAGMPYRLVGATRFYARREIKDVVAFLRLTHNPSDSVSLTRIINVPPRTIGNKTLQVLTDGAQDRAKSLWWAVEAVSVDDAQAPPLGTRSRSAVTGFHKMARGWIEARDYLTVPELLDRILEETAYSSYLLDGTEEGEDRWNNVQEFRSVALEYAELTLTDFLADVALVSDVDNLSDGVDAPTLLTLHSAKGLEFPLVFVTGLEEGLLPHSRSLDDPEELAEERRLLYVGMTRAKDRLYLTHAFSRARFGTSDTSAPSRFLVDIPSGLVEGVHGQTTRSPTTWTGGSTQTSRRFSSGDHVSHQKFGGGVVVESRVKGGDEEVTVVFDEAGIRRIIGSFLNHAD